MSSTLARKPRKRSLTCYRKKLLIGFHMPRGMVYESLTVEQIMDFAYVSRSTAYKWISGKVLVPKPYLELLQIKSLGLMPDPEFRDYRLLNGSIVAPNGKSFSIRALEHFNMVYQQNSDFAKELDMYRLEKTVSPGGDQLIGSD